MVYLNGYFYWNQNSYCDVNEKCSYVAPDSYYILLKGKISLKHIKHTSLTTINITKHYLFL